MSDDLLHAKADFDADGRSGSQASMVTRSSRCCIRQRDLGLCDAVRPAACFAAGSPVLASRRAETVTGFTKNGILTGHLPRLLP
jgi:hypothetical protein